jgi:hypothetical protein
LTETLAQVVAKRREPTSWLERPAPSESESVELETDPSPSAPNIPMPNIPMPSIEVPSVPESAVSDDEWLKPVQSEDPIVVAPPPPAGGENEIALWEEEKHEEPAQPAPPAPPAAPHGGEPDADIKHLTESTIRMSGLDDYQWSVNEPSLKPTPPLLDNGDSTFDIEPAHATTPDKVPPFKPQPAYAPPPPSLEPELDSELESISVGSVPVPAAETQHASSPSDFYRKADAPSAPSQPAFTPPPPAAAKPAAPAAPAPKLPQPDASVVGLSSIEIEDLLRKELRKELQKLLPDLAERIIKQEIHKMLSEST